jgi:hypothetical protein
MGIYRVLIGVSLSFWIGNFPLFSGRALSQDSSALPPSEFLLPISGAAILPALSDRDQAALITEARSQTDYWLGLAGVGKIRNPDPLPDDLEAYRQAWAAVNPAIAPFLGSWRDGEDFPYSVSIFPSPSPNKVCVLEFRPAWNYPLWSEMVGAYIGKEVLLEQILSFSVATVEAGQLRSETLQTATGALFRYENSDAQLMGLQDDAGTVHIVAASALPRLPDKFPDTMATQVMHALTTYGCTLESPDVPQL